MQRVEAPHHATDRERDLVVERDEDRRLRRLFVVGAKMQVDEPLAVELVFEPGFGVYVGVVFERVLQDGRSACVARLAIYAPAARA